ncbi:MAG: PTS transporter subunit EIIB [Clostridiaceae bacterium]|nr:PTS transporter subunit EIIB [Clostridiaceae bacterium]
MCEKYYTLSDACITRLRLTVADSSNISDEELKALGATGVIRPNKKNLQVVVGTKAELIVDEMKKYL